MKQISAALLAVQKNLDPVHKGKSGYGYKYADLPAVMDSCLEHLNNAGIVAIQAPVQTEKQAAAINTRLIHAESGEEISGIIEVPYSEQAKMSSAQCYGSAMTYARRYALVAMLGIVTEDDDGAGAGRRETQREKPAGQPQKNDKAASALHNAKAQAAAFKALGGTADEFWRANSAVLQRINAYDEFGDYLYPEARKVLIEAGLVEV